MAMMIWWLLRANDMQSYTIGKLITEIDMQLLTIVKLIIEMHMVMAKQNIQ